jgi:uroporphyrinogen-III synthase
MPPGALPPTHVLVTRPEPECERTAALVAARGHPVLIEPMLVVEPVPDVAPSAGAAPPVAVVLTSANAARALAASPALAQLTALPAFGVGARTAAAARAAGFTRIDTGAGDQTDLARLITTRLPPGPLVYLAGEARAGDLRGALQAKGFTVDLLIVYRAVPRRDMSAALRQALADRSLGAVLHYSRRSAESFVAVTTRAGFGHVLPDLAHYCLSAAVTDPLLRAGAVNVKVAPSPGEDALLALLPAPGPAIWTPEL